MIGHRRRCISGCRVSDTVQRRKNSCLRDAFVFFLWHTSRHQPIAVIGGRCRSRADNLQPGTVEAGRVMPCAQEQLTWSQCAVELVVRLWSLGRVCGGDELGGKCVERPFSFPPCPWPRPVCHVSCSRTWRKSHRSFAWRIRKTGAVFSHTQLAPLTSTCTCTALTYWLSSLSLFLHNFIKII